MSLKYFDRVKGTTTTTGTGDYTIDLAAAAGYKSFAVALNTNDEVYYCVEDGTDWEVCRGTFNDSGDTMTRDTVFASSNSDAAVNWGAGTRDIYIVLPAIVADRLSAVQVDSRPNLGDTNAGGLDSIAIGDNANAYEAQTIAIGESARAGINDGASAEAGAIAIGYDSIAYEIGCIALGRLAEAGEVAGTAASYCTAIGYDALADRIYAVAIGYQSKAYGNSSIAIGINAYAKETDNIAIGNTAQTGQTNDGTAEANCIAIGDAFAYESGGIAIGDGSFCGDQTTSNSPNCIAIGVGARSGNNSNGTPSEPNCIAIGNSADAYEAGGTAIGNGATTGLSAASGNDIDSVAIGTAASATAYRGVAIGPNSESRGDASTALGYSSDARTDGSISIGEASQAGQTDGSATNSDAISIGTLSTAYEYRSVAIGYDAQSGTTSGTAFPDSVAVGSYTIALGQETTCIGHAAISSADFAVAVGADAEADGDYSIAIGNNSECRDNYTIAIGYLARSGTTLEGTANQYAIAIGANNFAYHQQNIVIGEGNTVGSASGSAAQFSWAIGEGNTCSAYEEVVMMGRGITALRDSEWVYGIDAAGTNDYRRGHCGWAITTSDETPTRLKLNLLGLDYFDMPTTSTLAFDILVTAASSTASKSAAYHIVGAIYRDSGDAILLGTPTVTVLGENDAAYDCIVAADTTNDGLYIEVTGGSGNTVKWTAHMQFAESDV